MKTVIRSIFLPAMLLLMLSGCIIEDLDPADLIIIDIEEYESARLFGPRAFVDFSVENLGDLTAFNVEAELVFFNGSRELEVIWVDLPSIRASEVHTASVNTRMDFSDYDDFEIYLYWD